MPPTAPAQPTPAVRRALVVALADGKSLGEAARAAGVGLATLRSWLGRGAKGREPYRTLLSDLNLAREASRR